MPGQWSLAQAYDSYPRIEEELQDVLDDSLDLASEALDRCG